MAKISLLPPAAAVDGNETVVLVKDGQTRRSQLTPLVAAAVSPFVDDASASATAAAAYSNFIQGDLATAEAATDEGDRFSISVEGQLIAYVRTADGSAEIGRAVTPAALNDPDIGPNMLRFRQPLPQAQGVPAYNKMQDFVSVRDYDQASGQGGDDRPALQKMFDDIASVGKGRAYLPRPDVSWKISSGLDVDIARVPITSDGGLIDAGDMLIGAALRLHGTEPPPYFQAQNALLGINVRGPRWGGGAGGADVDGVIFDTAPLEGGASSHITGLAGNVYGFRRGATFGEHCYLVHLHGWDFWFNGTALYAPAPAFNDTGENIRLFGGAIYNNLLAIYMSAPSMDLFTTGTSIDYNADIADIQAGRWHHTGHIEAATYDSAPMRVAASNGAGIILGDGHFLLRDGPNHAMQTYFEIGAGGFVVLGDMFCNNLTTATKQWYSGDGDFQITGRLSGFGISSLPPLPNRARGRMLDPQFEGASVIDNIWISNGANISSRLVSDGGTVSMDGGRLKLTKIFGAGGPFTVSIAVPCKPGEAIGAILSYSKAAGMGTAVPVFLNMSYAALREGAIPSIMKADTFASVSLEFGAAAINPTELTYQGNIAERADSWASHAVIEINLFGASAGDFFLDFLQMDKFA